MAVLRSWKCSAKIRFEPEDKKEALHLDEKQQKLSVKYDSESSAVVNKYIKGEERSFTIIAYPLPEISENADEYEKIFHEIVRINTLDYNQYKEIQQTIIDTLDGAEYVHVKGCGNNQTDMRVSLQKITNPQKETVFENCLADVNIPLGEVFTSPVLKGTEGILNVSSVYLNDLKFINLKVSFKDGMVTDYSCDNFEDAKKGRQYFKENVLLNHDTLPIGEFAIGTNTTAYVMANQYDIVYKLPILIVEKWDRILQSVIHVIPERRTILYTIRTVRKLFHGIMKFPYCERPSRKKHILTAIRTLRFRMMKSAVFRQYRKMAAKPSLLKTADLYLQAVKN